jgi:hypothetical protein
MPRLLCRLHVPCMCIMHSLSSVSCMGCVSHARHVPPLLQMVSPCGPPCCGWTCAQLTKLLKCWPQVIVSTCYYVSRSSSKVQQAALPVIISAGYLHTKLDPKGQQANLLGPQSPSWSPVKDAHSLSEADSKHSTMSQHWVKLGSQLWTRQNQLFVASVTLPGRR